MTNLKEGLLTSGCWRGHPCFVVGGGPSLRGFDFTRLRGELTIGVNLAFEFFSPTILLAIDARFWDWVLRDMKYGEWAAKKLLEYQGLKVGIRISARHGHGVHEIKSLGVSGPIIPPEQGIYHGNNSGYSAVALALALGANPVYVLGIDLRYIHLDPADSTNIITHFHGGHPETTSEKDLVRKCSPPFAELARNEIGRRVKIINLEWPGNIFSLLGQVFEVVPFPEKHNFIYRWLERRAQCLNQRLQ